MRIERTDNANMQALANEFKKLTAKVGFFESDKYPDGTPVAYVAAIQEFGHAEGGIPSRPFMRTAIEQAEVEKVLKRLILAATQGNLSAQQALAQLGLYVEGEVRKSIAEGDWEPLKQGTLDARQSRKRTQGVATKPLIDTAQMFQAVKSVVEAKQ